MADVKVKKPVPTKSEQTAGVEPEEAIHVFGARVHNLKNIDITFLKIN